MTKTEKALMAAHDWLGSYEGMNLEPDEYGAHDTELLHTAWQECGTVAKVLKSFDFPEDIVLAYEYMTKRLDARGF